jgi:transcription elongation factor Elf1
MSALITKTFTCNRCGQSVAIEFDPASIVNEDFIRRLLVCDVCADKRRGKFKAPVKPVVEASLPYKDE